MAGNSKELKADDIPILGNWDELPTPQAQRLFDCVLHRFLNLPNMPEIIKALAMRNRPIRYGELRYYLLLMHSILLPEIDEMHFEHGVISESVTSQLPEELSVPAMLESILNSIRSFEEINTDEEDNITLQHIQVIDYSSRLSNQMIIRRYKNLISDKTRWKNSQLVIADFPMVYLKEVERLLFPKWYTACFMQGYHNSSVWGHYACNHKGVCLIFESKQIGESDGFELYYGTGNSVREIRLSEIIYKNKPAEVDFFRSVGRLTGKDVKEHWYTDEEGNVSECASHIPLDGDMDSDEMVDWRNRHWNTFYRDITVKTKDWKYEEEYRLILEDGLRQFDEEESRALRYDFNSLKGIIFGIKASDEDRLKILQIIQKKCEKHDRTDFKFYQAYYSPESGGIRKDEIQLS